MNNTYANLTGTITEVAAVGATKVLMVVPSDSQQRTVFHVVSLGTRKGIYKTLAGATKAASKI